MSDLSVIMCDANSAQLFQLRALKRLQRPLRRNSHLLLVTVLVMTQNVIYGSTRSCPSYLFIPDRGENHEAIRITGTQEYFNLPSCTGVLDDTYILEC